MTERRVGKPGPSKPLRGYGSMKDDPLTKQISAALEKRNEVIFENAALRARIQALETALAPFGRQYDEVVFDGMSDELLEEYKAFCFEPLKVADLRRARSVLSEKQS